MKRKASDIRPAAERYTDKVELALVEKFNRSQECAGQWVSEELEWVMEMLDAGGACRADGARTVHEEGRDMSDVTGPISTLPGAHHSVPEGVMCDRHPDRAATHRVQGETDSFGCELNDMCDECYAAHKRETAVERATGMCEWCGRPATDLRPRRDYEEGSYGRLYDVCGACVRRQNKEAEEELERSGFYDDCGD